MRVAAACLSRALLAAACLFLVAAAPGAEEAPVSPTLEKIRAANAVYIGYREAAIPFSYLAGGGEAIGFAIDLCRHVTDAIQAQLNLQHLTVVPVPTTPGARQIMIETGTVDLDCGGTINTEQRQRDLAFSSTIFVAGIQALVSKDAGIRSFADLQGKTVATVFGTTAAAYLTSAAARQGLQVSHRGSRDQAEGLQFLLRGEVAALVLDDVSLRGLLLQVAAAERLMLLDDRFGFEPWAIALRRHDPQFKKLVDRTLSGLMQSGEFARIYERWFTSPIPPDGGNLHLPMGDALRQLMLTPNDRGA
jgi:glutamate/aspartate transport system substrate-binding protein